MKRLFSFVMFLSIIILPMLGSAETFYVRPSGGDYGSQDGSCYANAWNGFKSVIWGNEGVKGGDTLFVCGKHSIEYLYIRSGGTPGNLITLRGDYAPDRGSIGVTSPYCIDIRNCGYLAIQDLEFSEADAHPVYIYAQSSDVREIKILRCIIDAEHGSHAVMILEAGSNTVEDVEIGRCTLKNAGGGVGSGNHDGVNAYSITRGLYVHDCVIFNNGGEGIDVAKGENNIIERNTIRHCGTGIKVHGQQGRISGNILRHNLLYDFSGITFGIALQDASNSNVMNNTIYMGRAGYGALLFDAPNNPAHFFGNMIKYNIIYGSSLSEGAVRITAKVKKGFSEKNTFDFNCIHTEFTNYVKIGENPHREYIADNNWASDWLADQPHDINLDPRFKQVSNNDFSLRTDSPCINFDGMNIGAFELVGITRALSAPTNIRVK